ncbi:GNAT family N-acetyltransferase [Streptomyces sp. NPDC048405]|uniref:GNAT family N-acetyltransferase n=1 Tax=unclassified Streptomyces TaxID=2593676 RepID=UPI003721E106|nr:GNAT family N-acetyltransferase [Streptomyces sp. NBC_01124]WSU05782.1 GNAT family N-acetyltransferase [Streptomyces sp. NBC_01124]
MTDQARTRRAAVALAARGEGQAAAALGALALQDSPLPADGPLSPLAAAIDHHGGCVPLPYGQGQCWVARTGEAVSGMLYATPPIRWLQQQPSPHRNSLIHSLVEIELLAVAESHRTQGVGTVLLQEAENNARANGTHLALAKIRVGAFPIMRWYRRRGYTIAAQNEPLVFATRHGLTSCDDGSDGYQLAAKALQPGTALRRTARAGTPLILLERDT